MKKKAFIQSKNIHFADRKGALFHHVKEYRAMVVMP